MKCPISMKSASHSLFTRHVYITAYRSCSCWTCSGRAILSATLIGYYGA